MPTLKKEQQISDIKGKLEKCTIAVATGYAGMSASHMNQLRSEMRSLDIEYMIIKNTLTLRAASELGKEGIIGILDGPTGLAFGYGDVTSVAKGINEFITSSRLPLEIHGAIMDNSVLDRTQVVHLASLPSKDALVAKLLGQLQSPITSLVNILSSPTKNLAVVLQRRLEQMS